MNRAPLFAALLFGCAHSTPEEMTAAEHRAEALRHAERSKQEEAMYQPGADVRYPSRTPFSEPGGDWVAYNPAEHHLDRADRELRAAAAHAAAATKLEAFEDEACRAIPPAARAACPLLASWVTQVQETGDGLRLVLKGSVDGEATTRQLNCHLAYAYASGFDRPSCPLFVKGMEIRLAQPGVIEMTARDRGVVQKLKAEARRIFVGPGDAAPVSRR